jgi:hypothetical protein
MAKTNVKVKLLNEDGNAFLIIGKVNKALKKAGHVELAKQYLAEVTNGDYDHLLQVTMQYVEII